MNTDRRRATSLVLLMAGACAPFAAWAQADAAAASTIYTCVNAAGRKLTSDRPIAECNDREQRVLNKDGSLRTVLQPPMTSEERAAAEEADRKRAQDRASLQEAVRRDRNLLARYPNEAAHRKARDAALKAVNDGVSASEQRVADLQKERKPLTDEAEFYVGKTLPTKLRLSIESIDVSIEAQRSLVENQKVEGQRVTALYDAELERLRKLWAGAPPGSLGPPPPSGALTAAPAATRKR